MSSRYSPMLALFAEADDGASALAQASGLRCPTGCGHCCAHHRPHTTVSDMMLLAEEEVRAGNAEERLKQLRALPDDAPCVYFVAGRLPGGCTAYALRPLLCRLFGFSATRDKHGERALSACHVHKREVSDAVDRASRYVSDGGAVHVMADLQTQADAIDPDRSREQMPINRALTLALEWAALSAQYRTE